MRIFSTFSGIGGFEVGIHNAWLRSQDKGQAISGSQTRDTQGQLEKIEIGGDNIWTVDSGTDTAMLIEERIAELKAQQEVNNIKPTIKENNNELTKKGL